MSKNIKTKQEPKKMGKGNWKIQLRHSRGAGLEPTLIILKTIWSTWSSPLKSKL